MKYGYIKKLFAAVAIVFLSFQVRATHIVGGEIIYECMGSNNYRVIMKVYRDCFNGVPPLDNPAYLGIFNANGVLVNNPSVFLTTDSVIPNISNNPCIIFPPNICVEEGTYVFTVNLPPSPGGYTIAYQRCCRNNTIGNIFDPANTGTTIFATIPDQTLATCNNSPYFNNYPPTVICVNYPLIFDHSATDPDGDSLVYELCAPFNGGTALNPQPIPPTAPPYLNVIYNAGYSYTDPLGTIPPMTIDPVTGLLTVTPDALGQYVVGVCCKEYRNGNLIGIHFRDFQFNVSQCSLPAIAATPGVINTCDAFTYQFPNYSIGATSYHWDFGVPGVSNDTSNQFAPLFTFPDTGVYVVTLIANPGSSCGDTATCTVYVYPTLTGAVNVPDECFGVMIPFQDLSTTVYGNINSWHWDFGDGNFSSLQNPNYLYTNPGTYNIVLQITTNLGCADTVQATINVYPSPIATADPDTLICYLDTLQLAGTGNGNYLWSPNYNLSSNTVANPFASPDVSTVYTLIVTNNFGCSDTDDVTISVFDTVYAHAAPDTVICPGDTVHLTASGGLIYQWSPPNGLSGTTVPTPIAQPDSTTTYVMTTWIGSCNSSDTITIGVKPLPQVFAGPDEAICLGDSVMISASGCTYYTWAPGDYLSSDSVQNPVAFPYETTNYVVSALDTDSCPVIVSDTLIVTVYNPIQLVTTPDTVVVLGTSAQLHSTGAVSYLWTPPDFLNNNVIYNPVSTPTSDITYYVFALDVHGCPTYDSVNLKIIADPVVVVPNAFTPNGDGLNDEFFPIVLGYFQLNTFRIFNRWGEMLFETNDIDQHWDGKHSGVNEEVGTYVYYLLGSSSISGKKYEMKGNFVLLR